MNLKEKRAATLKAAQEIVAKAQGEKRALTTEEQADIEAKTSEITELDTKIKAAVKSDATMALLTSFGAPDPNDNDREAKGARTPGDHFIKSLNGRSLKEPGTFAAPIFSKAATDDQRTDGGGYGPLLTDIDRSFVTPKRERLVIADLLGTGAVSGNAITYPVFGTLEGGTAFIAQGGQKPQMHVTDPTWRTDPLSEVAGWFRITDDMAEDLPYVISEINTTALYDLAAKEEAALLSGNGAAPNLRGILNRDGLQTLAQAAGDSVADTILRGLNRVQTATDLTADGIVINPADYEELRLNKDGNGQYFGGGYFSGQYGNGSIIENPALWGRRTVVTTAVAQGTVLVGAFATAAKVFRKGGVRVESTNSHEDDFTNDKITIRVRERIGLQVKYPSAFVRVTLTPGV